MDVIENRAIKALSFDQNWVGWRYEQRNGSKPTKPPINPRGGYAKCNDPSTWGSLEEALAAKEKMGLDGIGFMLTTSASVTAIDIDNCIVGGELSPLAREVIASVNSYSEISPSGAGVRILAIGSLPDGGRKNTELGIEVYDRDRYVTITGNRLAGTPADIEDRSEQLKQFHQKYFNKPTPTPTPNGSKPALGLDDQSIIDKASKAGNGAKFRTLWSGDTSGYPSPSEADQALANILAFWTKDEAQIDRLFRQSGLSRPKWDEKHNAGGATYGQMTIEKALAGVTDTYTPGHKEAPAQAPAQEETKGGPRFKLLSLDELFKRPPKQWLWPKLIGQGDLAMIFGESGSLKSFFTIELLTSGALGKPLGEQFAPSKPLRVAYFAGEGQQGIANRFLAASNKYQVNAATAGIKVCLNVPQLYDTRSLDSIFVFLEEINEQFDVIVLDTLHTSTAGANENDARDMGLVIHHARKIIEQTGATVILVHHSNKNGNYRGSSALHGAMDTILQCSKVGEGIAKVESFKQKDASPINPLYFKLQSENYSESAYVTWLEREVTDLSKDAKAENEARQQVEAILQEAGEPLSQSEVVRKATVGRNNVLAALNYLERDRSIVAHNRGRVKLYTLNNRTA